MTADKKPDATSPAGISLLPAAGWADLGWSRAPVPALAGAALLLWPRRALPWWLTTSRFLPLRRRWE